MGTVKIRILLKNPLPGWISTCSTSLTGMPNAALPWPSGALEVERESFRKEGLDFSGKVGGVQPNSISCSDPAPRKRPHGLKTTTTLLGESRGVRLPTAGSTLGPASDCAAWLQTAVQGRRPSAETPLPQPKPQEGRQKLPIDTSAPFCHYPAMLGKPPSRHARSRPS